MNPSDDFPPASRGRKPSQAFHRNSHLHVSFLINPSSSALYLGQVSLFASRTFKLIVSSRINRLQSMNSARCTPCNPIRLLSLSLVVFMSALHHTRLVCAIFSFCYDFLYSRMSFPQYRALFVKIADTSTSNSVFARESVVKRLRKTVQNKDTYSLSVNRQQKGKTKEVSCTEARRVLYPKGRTKMCDIT
jgi:hypothetical protein